MADTTVRTYDPKNVIVTFGTLTLGGFAEGSFIKIERSGDLFTSVKGADGRIDRVNNNNNLYNIEITLKQVSPTNEALAAVAIADSLTNGGVLPFSIKDLRSSRAYLPTDALGDNIVFAGQAWISKDPETEYSDAMSNRVWTFSAQGVKLDSGND